MRNMIKNKYTYRNICGAAVTITAVCVFMPVWLNFIEHHNQTEHLQGLGNIGMAMIAYVMLAGLCLHVMGGYNIGVDRRLNVVTAQVIAFFITNILEVFVSCAITGQFRFAPIFIREYFFMWIVQSILVSAFTARCISVYRREYPPLSVLEVRGRHTNELEDKIRERSDKYRIDKVVDCGEEDEIAESLDEYDALLLNDVPTDVEKRLVKICYDRSKRIYITPKLSDIILNGAAPIHLFDTPLLLTEGNPLEYEERVIKRAWDIVFSLILLILLSPIMLITALIIKLSDGGPVFYRQIRCTKNGRRFEILKFRSMVVDAEKAGRAVLATKDDPRITKVGRIIRKCRIDELPQLINVFKGDMSFVGPRPERPEFIEKYMEEMPEFSYRMKVRAGITGYAQLYGKYNTKPYDKLKFDLYYIEQFSLGLDIRLMILTFKILFTKESTEGTSERIEA